MIQFWTTWNFLWYSGFKLKFYNLNSPLKASIFATGIIGGYLVYVYPRRMKIILNKTVYYLPYPLLVSGDIIFHQYPMFDIIFNNYEYDKVCVLYTYVPLLAWYNTSRYLLKGKLDKLYGVPINNILFISSFVACGFGIFHHLIKNKK